MDSEIARLQTLITHIRQRRNPIERHTLARHLSRLSLLYAQNRQPREAIDCLEEARNLLSIIDLSAIIAILADPGDNLKSNRINRHCEDNPSSFY